MSLNWNLSPSITTTFAWPRPPATGQYTPTVNQLEDMLQTILGAIVQNLERLQATKLDTSPIQQGQHGIGIPVSAGATSIHIDFFTPVGVQYGVMAAPDWSTAWTAINKATTGFDVTFATPAPAAGGQVDVLVFTQ